MPYFSNMRVALILSVLVAAPAMASSLFPGKVSGVPSGQSLSLRATPSPAALQVGRVNNGDELGMTGRCRRLNPNGSLQINFRIDGPSIPEKRGAKMAQTRTWCEIWFEVKPNIFKSVWARGRFIAPG